MRILAIIIVMISMSVATAQAQNAVDARQTAQRARIAQGVQQDDLNKRETIGLVTQQQRIRKAEHVAKRDGVVTCEEKLQLNRMQRHASRNIAVKRNN